MRLAVVLIGALGVGCSFTVRGPGRTPESVRRCEPVATGRAVLDGLGAAVGASAAMAGGLLLGSDGLEPRVGLALFIPGVLVTALYVSSLWVGASRTARCRAIRERPPG
jgi:hypothetical protein